MMTATYRAAQFVWHLCARVSPEEQGLAHYLLPPPLAALFDRMPRADRRHALDVFHALRSQGYDDPDLLAAALLHDIAKANGLPLLYRVAIVLVRALAPGWLNRLDRKESWWRHAFHISLHHPQIGAEMIAAVGGNNRLTHFVRHHEAPRAAGDDLPPEDIALLEAFHRLDNRH